MQTNNIASMDSLLHEDLLFNSPDDQTITNEMDLEYYHSGKVNIQALTPIDLQINEISDTIVIAVTVEY